MAHTTHEAAGGALGYLFQTQWPLVDFVRRSRNEPDCQLTLELLDDVAWVEEGTPRELIQTKHHVESAGGLGDMSVDLWRTIGVWIDAHPPGDAAGPTMTLVSTGVALAGSAAAALRPQQYDSEFARGRLDLAATTSQNQITEGWRRKFISLDEAKRTVFVSRMCVMDGAPHIEDLDTQLRKELHLAAPLGHEAAFVALIWDWWMRQAIALLRRSIATVSALDLAAAIDGIRDQFGDDSLPTLVPREAFDEGTIGDYDTRIFVHQLNLVDTPILILQRAVQDYYRATVQSAEWIENNLVDLPEVAKFKADLLDEWERAFAWATSRLPADASQEDKKTVGRQLLQRCLDTTEIHIRPRYREPFYFRGKFHELADERLVGWHPDFAALLKQLLVDVT